MESTFRLSLDQERFVAGLSLAFVVCNATVSRNAAEVVVEVRRRRTVPRTVLVSLLVVIIS